MTTIADLHDNVSNGSTRLLSEIDTEGVQPSAARPADVAIVGMAAIMPGAPDLEAFWSSIVRGVNSITEVPPERWNPDLYYDPTSTNGDKTPSKWGGFLDPVPFDPLQYGIPPRSLAAIEPVQLLALEVSRRALGDAGYLDRDFDRERAAVIFGAEAGTDLAGGYGFRAMWRQYAGDLPEEIDAVLPSLTEDSFPGILANVISGRVANRLDLGGSNFTVDAACASSLAAVDIACKELVAGTSDMVICGGADLHNSIADYLAFASVHALSPTGQSRTFDASADGIALGEGVAALILKRLEDAERDGDRIYAVIKGIGSSSDGRSLGLTAPRPEGQERALERAYEAAGVSPAEVGLVEAHGTGTVVGDRTELETLESVFRRAGATSAACALGSVKSQIGHTKCAAGLAGMIKAALAIHHHVLPPTLNIETPNLAWSPDSPFTLNSTPRPWTSTGPRHAGISAFGFGGTNFHVVVSEAPHAAGRDPMPWTHELFLLRGANLEAGLASAARLLAVLDRGEPWRLRDLAYTAAAGAEPVQVAIVASGMEDLRAGLQSALARRARDGVYLRNGDGPAGGGKVAFLFPGQGSQRPGMLRDLFLTFPDLERFLDLGRRWVDLVYPPTAWTEADRAAQRDALTDTRAAQPALGIAGLAASHLLRRLGIKADVLAGHSYGELVALCFAGAIAEEDLPDLSEARADAILAATAASGDPGAMAAVSAPAGVVAEHLAGIEGVVVANENSPSQTVISGATQAVAAAGRQLQAAGLSVAPLPVACAFHSPLVAGATAAFHDRLKQATLSKPAIPVYANTTARPYTGSAVAMRRGLAEHIAQPVRFASEIEAMYAAGARVFIEAGPGRVLTGLVEATLAGRPHLAIPIDRGNGDGLQQFLNALAQLAVNGIEADVEALFAGRGARMYDLAQASPLQVPPSAWWVNGQRAWPMEGELPEYAMKPVTQPVVDLQARRASQRADGREAVVIEYLRSMRQSMREMQDVVSGYLGANSSELLAGMEEFALPELERPAASSSPVPAASAPVAPGEPETPETVDGEVVYVTAAPIDIESLIVQIVSERTGYPASMLGLDLDLEADLSIDSIKRIEVLGAVTQRMGLSAETALEELPEDISRIKTLRGMIAALSEWETANRPAIASPAANTALQAPQAAAPAPALVAGTDEAAVEAAAVAPVLRYVPALSPTARLDVVADSLAGRTVAISGDDGPVAKALASALGQFGATAVEAGQNANAFVELAPLSQKWSERELGELFLRLRSVLEQGVASVIVVTPLGEVLAQQANGYTVPPGAGIPGMAKSFAREYPHSNIRVVNLSEDANPKDIAKALCGEIATMDDVREVAYLGNVRHLPYAIGQDAPSTATPGITLDHDSVVLVTGGARGIGAETAIALARRFQCNLELIGRTPLLEEPPSADLDGATLPELRRRLIAAGMTEPSAIEARASAILAGREIRRTLRSIEDAGGSAVYTVADVRDGKAFGAAIKAIYKRRARIDGVIHAAGVLADGMAAEKSPEAFARVVDTKVAGAITLSKHLRDDAQFLAFFSSVSGIFGNRGQTDYSTANDFLDKFAVTLNARLPGRVFSIDWGPWAGTGMVTPELAREYERRGVNLIDPTLGTQSFITELLYGAKSDCQVILTATEPGVFAG